MGCLDLLFVVLLLLMHRFQTLQYVNRNLVCIHVHKGGPHTHRLSFVLPAQLSPILKKTKSLSYTLAHELASPNLLMKSLVMGWEWYVSKALLIMSMIYTFSVVAASNITPCRISWRNRWLPRLEPAV